MTPVRHSAGSPRAFARCCALCERYVPDGLVAEEPFTALAPQPARTDHLAEQGRGAVLALAHLVAEQLHDGEAHVEADEVGQSQRAHGMIGSELHGGIDVLSGGHAFLQHEDRFVDHGDEDAVDHEAGGFIHGDRRFAQPFGKRLGGFVGFVGSGGAADDLDEGHAGHGIEEMQAHHLVGASHGGGHGGDAQAGRIGGEDAAGHPI